MDSRRVDAGRATISDEVRGGTKAMLVTSHAAASTQPVRGS